MQCSTNIGWEFSMSSSVFGFSNAGPTRVYSSDVRVTARAFLAALFSFKSRPDHEPAPAQPTSGRVRNLLELHMIANQYDAIMPGVATELRSIAARR